MDTTVSADSRVPGRLITTTLLAGVCAVGLLACGSTTSDDAVAGSSVPMSAAVEVPAGEIDRAEPGTVVDFGESVALPADAFAAAGPPALFTVTGITRGAGIPDDITAGGDGYFVYVTLTSLRSKPGPAPTTDGLAGSPDGRTPALTLTPTEGVDGCTATAPPKSMVRGDSYATCLFAVADRGTELSSVIYWADTTGDAALDYKSNPVVWGTPAPETSASETPAPGETSAPN